MSRSLRSSFMMRHNSHNQRMLLYYSAYAWGMPFVWVLITVGAEKFELLPKGWNPSMRSTGTCFFVSMYKCIFDYFIRIKLLFRSIVYLFYLFWFVAGDINWRDHFVFFLLPAGLHVIVNCVLFIITAINCSRVKTTIHRMQCASDESNVSKKRIFFMVSKATFVPYYFSFEDFRRRRFVHRWKWCSLFYKTIKWSYLHCNLLRLLLKSSFISSKNRLAS